MEVKRTLSITPDGYITGPGARPNERVIATMCTAKKNYSSRTTVTNYGRLVRECSYVTPVFGNAPYYSPLPELVEDHIKKSMTALTCPPVDRLTIDDTNVIHRAHTEVIAAQIKVLMSMVATEKHLTPAERADSMSARARPVRSEPPVPIDVCFDEARFDQPGAMDPTKTARP